MIRFLMIFTTTAIVLMFVGYGLAQNAVRKQVSDVRFDLERQIAEQIKEQSALGASPALGITGTKDSVAIEMQQTVATSTLVSVQTAFQNCENAMFTYIQLLAQKETPIKSSDLPVYMTVNRDEQKLALVVNSALDQVREFCKF